MDPRRSTGETEGAAALADTLLPAEPTDVMPSHDQALQPGRPVGEYVVEKPLGAGAFGTVYSGVHPVIGKAVAIKVLSMRYSVDPGIVSRFVDEARAVNRIGHAGIIDIFAFGRLEDGRQYYVMELLEGQTLLELLEARGRLPLDETLAILEPMGRALDAAHASGIAHRDLKPANIFLARDEDRWRPKLLDFGVAKLMGDTADGKSRTETGATVGTPAYMSPEQCLGKGVDHRTDIYSFGIVAYQMLTGRLPFDADSAFSIMAAHLNEPPPDVRALAPDVPESVGRVLRWLLSKDPAERPRTLAEALSALSAAARGVDVPGAALPARRSDARRRRTGLVAAVAVAVALSAWGGFWAWRSRVDDASEASAGAPERTPTAPEVAPAAGLPVGGVPAAAPVNPVPVAGAAGPGGVAPVAVAPERTGVAPVAVAPGPGGVAPAAMAPGPGGVAPVAVAPGPGGVAPASLAAAPASLAPAPVSAGTARRPLRPARTRPHTTDGAGGDRGLHDLEPWE